MFLGIRDIAYAKGRFALMTAVVGLITLLLVMLSGLTGGLGKQNTSALEALNPESVMFHGDKASFTESSIDEALPGTVPLGITQTRLEGETTVGVAVFGLPVGYEAPGGKIPAEGVLVSESVDVKVGETVELGGTQEKVVGVVPDLQYSHSPVVWASTFVWQAVGHTQKVGTVLLGGGERSGYVVTDLKGAFDGLASYKSEKGSLQTMQGFLYAIAALVTVAFLTVWTIQRTRDMAIVKALGAAGSYLLRDALLQAAVVLGVGVGAGLLVGLGLGALVKGAVPFEMSMMTSVVPAAGVFLLGMGGALLATRKVAKTDPMMALGGNA